MMELPEAYTISKQMQPLCGRTIQNVIAGKSPHGFAFYNDDPKNYPALLEGKTIQKIKSVAGYVEMETDKETILLGEGVNIRLFGPEEKIPEKHQLLLEFDNKSVLVCTIQMYGSMWAFPKGEMDNPYYAAAREKPSPLADGFTRNYFEKMMAEAKQTLSAKAFLATEQRIPGLGNGVLPDILFNAGIHPKRKINTLTDTDKKKLFYSIQKTLQKIADEGGRNTEKDLFGKAGGYQTILSSQTLKTPCPVCSGQISKEQYLGGAIYFCPNCQKI
jgi:Formamidopyrimidine-DNA glycosylase